MAKKFEAIVLSHTELGYGFCTNILVRYANGNLGQLRPRTGKNDTLPYNIFGYSEQEMRERWLPGRVVEVTGPIRHFINGYERQTHPEDRLFKGIKMTDREYSRAELRELIDPLVHQSIFDLYPNVSLAGCTNAASVPPDEPQEHSVGYVAMQRIRRGDDGYVFFTDMAGNRWRSKLKGIHIGDATHDGRDFLPFGDAIEADDMVVRLALSAEWKEKCWVMASDIFW